MSVVAVTLVALITFLVASLLGIGRIVAWPGIAVLVGVPVIALLLCATLTAWLDRAEPEDPRDLAKEFVLGAVVWLAPTLCQIAPSLTLSGRAADATTPAPLLIASVGLAGVGLVLTLHSRRWRDWTASPLDHLVYVFVAALGAGWIQTLGTQLTPAPLPNVVLAAVRSGISFLIIQTLFMVAAIAAWLTRRSGWPMAVCSALLAGVVMGAASAEWLHIDMGRGYWIAYFMLMAPAAPLALLASQLLHAGERRALRQTATRLAAAGVLSPAEMAAVTSRPHALPHQDAAELRAATIRVAYTVHGEERKRRIAELCSVRDRIREERAPHVASTESEGATTPGRRPSLHLVRSAVATLIAFLLLLGLAVGAYAWNNVAYYGIDDANVERAGIKEKTVHALGHTFRYAEGPANGPNLLLLHGQASDWHSFAPSLPELTKHYHVIALEYYGHGGTDPAPDRYRAVLIAEDLRVVAKQLFAGKPYVVHGHSSGGQLAALMAAAEPDLIRGVFLEDPPMFTTLLPRAKSTWNYVDLATACHDFLAQREEKDFVYYSLANGRIWSLLPGFVGPFKDAALRERRAHPDRPLISWALPASMNDLDRSMQTYDPRFGDTFYTDAWDEGFDHEATLRAIRQPAFLVHTTWSYRDGILEGAMDENDARRVASLIPNARMQDVVSTHDFHTVKPAQFDALMEQFMDSLPAQK